MMRTMQALRMLGDLSLSRSLIFAQVASASYRLCGRATNKVLSMLRTGSVLMLLIIVEEWSFSQSITWLLPACPPGSDRSLFRSVAWGVTADGRKVAEFSFQPQPESTSNFWRGTRWEVNPPTVVAYDLSSLDPEVGVSAAYDISAIGGTVIVGVSDGCSSGSCVAPVRWRIGIEELCTPDNTHLGTAWGVSAHGEVIVGVYGNSQGHNRPVKWLHTFTCIDLGTLPGGCCGAAYDVSGDGNVPVGMSLNAQGYYRPVRWPGPVDLGTLGGCCGEAWGASWDGTVIVGYSSTVDGPEHAFRYTIGVMQDLGTLPDTSRSAAYDVSADGNIVVGKAWKADTVGRAFRWTPTRGMEDLNVVFAHILGNARLTAAYGVSLDGRYIVGEGYNTEGGPMGFLLDTWCSGDINGDGCVDDADLLAILSAWGTSGSEPARHEDINKDGIVDDADFLIVLSHYVECC